MNAFRRLRYERGLTLREVSEGSGVSMSTVIRIEGDQKPGAATVKSLADYFQVEVTDLMPDEPRAAA